jgi:hypothetical protein
MKKLSAICLFAVGMMLVGGTIPSARAHCIRMTNFCDTIQLSNDLVEGGHLYGKWDWMCAGAGVSVYGNGGTTIEVGTRPASGTETYPYTVYFIFDKSTRLFDLIATDGNTTFLLRTAEPWTNSGGSCGLASPHPSSKGPSIMGR